MLDTRLQGMLGNPAVMWQGVSRLTRGESGKGGGIFIKNMAGNKQSVDVM